MNDTDHVDPVHQWSRDLFEIAESRGWTVVGIEARDPCSVTLEAPLPNPTVLTVTIGSRVGLGIREVVASLPAPIAAMTADEIAARLEGAPA